MNAWFREIDRAASEAEIVAAARDYVSLYSPPELARLPADCREIRIEDEADIPRWKEKLAEGYAHASERSASDHLGDLVAYLAHASDRLGDLRRSR